MRVQRVLVLGLVYFVLVGVVTVCVPPQHELLQREEREEAREHRRHHPLGIARFERMRQELEENGAEQRSDGERHDAGDPRPVQHERAGGGEGREHAARKRGDDDLHEDGQGEGAGGDTRGSGAAPLPVRIIRIVRFVDFAGTEFDRHPSRHPPGRARALPRARG